MKKKRKPGVFFSNPSGKDVSKGTKNTVETFLEGECEPADTDHLTGDYKKIISLSYEQNKRKRKRRI